MQRRLERFDAKLAQSGLDALLVTGQKNIYYLTDFWGTNATVFITKNRRLFLTDSRYILIAKQSVHGFDIIESKDPLKDIVKIIEADKLETIGFDNQVSFAYYQGLQAIFEGYTLSPQSNFMEELRMIKDEKELATIRKACSISDRAFTDVLDFIKPGQTTELQVANFLDFRMRELKACPPPACRPGIQWCRSPYSACNLPPDSAPLLLPRKCGFSGWSCQDSSLHASGWWQNVREQLSEECCCFWCTI